MSASVPLPAVQNRGALVTFPISIANSASQTKNMLRGRKLDAHQKKDHEFGVCNVPIFTSAHF